MTISEYFVFSQNAKYPIIMFHQSLYQEKKDDVHGKLNCHAIMKLIINSKEDKLQ